MGTCYNSTIVNADCETVWATLRDFHQLEWAAGVVEKVVVVGDAKGHEPGARRVLNDTFHETLLTIDDKARNLTYSIDDGPGPVAQGAVENYVGALRVCPVTDNGISFVEWTSSYDSPDDAAVGALCNPIYRALLAALKTHFNG
jgi:hypothetical protein